MNKPLKKLPLFTTPKSLLIVFLLLLTACGAQSEISSSSGTQSAPQQPPNAEVHGLISQLHMINATTGWVQSWYTSGDVIHNNILRTVDGGVHWKVVLTCLPVSSDGGKRLVLSPVSTIFAHRLSPLYLSLLGTTSHVFTIPVMEARHGNIQFSMHGRFLVVPFLLMVSMAGFWALITSLDQMPAVAISGKRLRSFVPVMVAIAGNGWRVGMQSRNFL